MDQRHKEYVDYYRVRAERAAESPVYAESAVVERERYEAIAGCARLEDFKQVNEQGSFGTRLAIAGARDQARARLQHYMETQQDIRAQGEATILQSAQSASDENDLMQRIGAIENQTSINLIVDGMIADLYSDFSLLEDIEVMQRAEIPPEYKKKDQERIAEMIAKETQDFVETTRRNREYKPDWQMDYQLAWQPRHRRVIPVPDETLQRRIGQHKQLVGLE